MFDIGAPEFLVIAIVALVVLGPERLPEVARRAGQFYRQAMDLRGQLMSQVQEAQRTFQEELAQVERAADAALNDVPLSPPPPPAPLRSVGNPRIQPDKQAEAGPFALAAWYRDINADVEVPITFLATRFGVQAMSLTQTSTDTLFGHAYITSSAALISPAHPFDDPFRPVKGVGTSLGGSRTSAVDAGRPLPVVYGPTSSAVDAERSAAIGTVITLLECGMHTKETGAGALDVSVAEFEKLLLTHRASAVIAV